MAKVILYLELVLTLVSVTTAVSTVNLRTAANYAILSKTGISTTGSTSIIGSIAVSPAASTLITGFGLTLAPGGTYSTSSLVSQKVYAASYNSPTPTILTAAISDMETAYNDAAGRLNPNFLNSAGGNLNGVTLTPGLYKWTTGVTVGGTVTLSGSSTAVFIFQVGGTLNFNSGSQIILTGGAQSKNVFWQVPGQVNLGSTAKAKGIILGKTAIVFGSGASLNTGRALAQTAITLSGNNVVQP